MVGLVLQVTSDAGDAKYVTQFFSWFYPLLLV